MVTSQKSELHGAESFLRR